MEFTLFVGARFTAAIVAICGARLDMGYFKSITFTIFSLLREGKSSKFQKSK
jgi:hypothetical protein